MPKQHSSFSIRSFRRELASIDAVPQLAILGILSGTVTGLVILVFRLFIEIPMAELIDSRSENFESLAPPYLLLLPIAGSVILAVLFKLIPPATRRVGVVHVLERLGRHQGHLPWQNALTQFFGGIIALGSGFSGGREGPAIHLGAACSSLMGQSLKLPNNSIRVLVGCGAAAAISASFNTPLAGVIFSMEVIIMEYTIAGFIPVILAAVVATLINQMVYGNVIAFDIQLDQNIEIGRSIPFVLLLGIVIGLLAAAFTATLKFTHQYAPSKYWLRIFAAGVITALVALICPRVLGIGYETVDQAHSGELALTVLFLACGLKLLLSAITVGLGVPVGVIGPTLFIGATAGGILGLAVNTQLPGSPESSGYYVLLGMGAMMGAVLQAPLAALLAVMELSHSADIILPAMLVIIIANMTASQIFKVKSIFLTQMELAGLDIRQNLRSTALNRVSVASLMSRNFIQVDSIISRQKATEYVKSKFTWILVVDDANNQSGFIIQPAELDLFLISNDNDLIDLTEIPAARQQLTAIVLQATLAEALDTINSNAVQALYIQRTNRTATIVGILTKQDIEFYYQT
ncbi:MAG: chloride channel protein [Pseudomonadales bacterium]|nr:chloride channel protein [Pseudomonadales bacterium]